GLLDLEFFGRARRRAAQPAQGGKAKQTGNGCQQNTSVSHDGLHGVRQNGCLRWEIRRSLEEVTPVRPEISHFLARSGGPLPLPASLRGEGRGEGQSSPADA